MESELEGMGRKRKCWEVIRCGASYGKWVEGIGRNWKEWNKLEGIGKNEKRGEEMGMN